MRNKINWYSNLYDFEEFESLLEITDQASLINFLNTNIIINPASLNINYTYVDINLLNTNLSVSMVTNFNILLKYLNTKNIYITSLNFERCNLTSGMIANLLDSINLSKCIELNLRFNKLNQDDAAALNKSLISNSTLQKLYLGFCIITGDIITTLLDGINLSKCTYLEVNNNILGLNDISALNKSLRSNFTLQYLFLGNINSINDMVSTLLDGINLSKCLDLSLSNNKLNNNDVLALNKSLISNSTLQYLYLDSCDMTAGMIATLLNRVNLSKCTFIFLYENKLGLNDVLALNKSLVSNSTLEYLNLGNCDMGAGMIATLLDGINLSKCISLDLNRNTLNNNDVLALKKSLGSKPVIQDLYLEYCDMKAGMVAILLENISSLGYSLAICTGNIFNQSDIDAIKKSINGINISICSVTTPFSPLSNIIITDRTSLNNFLNFDIDTQYQTNPASLNISFDNGSIDLANSKLDLNMANNLNLLLKYLNLKPNTYMPNLNLYSCIMTSGMLAIILDGVNLSKSEAIILHNTILNQSDILALNRSLGPLPNIKSITLEQCGMANGMVATLLNNINLSKCLDLNLSNNKLNDNDVLALNKSLGRIPKLTSLNLNYSGMKDDMVAILLNNITLDAKIYLQICEGNNFNQLSIDALKKSLLGNTNNILICKLSTNTAPNEKLNTPTQAPNEKLNTPTQAPNERLNTPTQASNNVQLNQETKTNTNKPNILLIIIIILICLVIGYIMIKRKK
jgi:hypothetical protein